MFESVNLVDALSKERNSKEKFLNKLLSALELSDKQLDAHSGLELFSQRDYVHFYQQRSLPQIKQSIIESEDWGKQGYYGISSFRASDVYSLDQIETVSGDYRLRFLPSYMFKGDIPEEALRKVQEIENANRSFLNEFFIMAPGSLFELEDAQKDPLLFAKIGDNQFLLIHRWGRDLHWTRKMVCYPLKSIYTFFTSIFAISILFALLIPTDWIDFAMRSWTMRVWLVFHIFIALSGFLIFMGSVYQRNFSLAEWNSKYFNG